MKKAQGPILSYLFLTKDIRLLRWILIFGGLLAVGVGIVLSRGITGLTFPLPVFIGVGGLALLTGSISGISQHVQRHMFDYTFLVFVFVYLAVIFISFLNHLNPALVPLLIAVQILFAIAFRNFFEFLIFAASSLFLFAILSFSLDNLQTLPSLFFILIVLVTSFTGAYVWSRERFLSKVNHSNQMLGDLLDNSVFGIFLMDLTTMEILYQNRIADDILNKIPGTLPTTYEAIVARLDHNPEQIRTQFQSTLPQKQLKTQTTLTDKEGNILVLDLFISKIRTLQNDSLLLKIRDISESKRVESALKDSEQNYQEIFNAGNSGIFILEPESYEVLDINNVLCKMLGYQREELLKLPLNKWGLEEYAERLKEFLTLTKQGQANQQEWVFLKQDGSKFPVELSANLAVLGGEFRLMLIVSNIQERIEKRKALKASEQKYRTLVEKMNEGLIMTDREENILFVNNRMCEIISLEEDELIGKRTYDVLGGNSAKELIKEKSLLRQQGVSDQYELKFRKKDGEQIWLSVTGSPYVQPPEEIVGSIAIITDITDRKLTELKLQEKNGELDAFVYKASHDLKGPLASIMGVTNIARAEVRDEQSLSYLELINKSTKRLDLILSELIDVTRINKAHLKLEEIDVSLLVDDIFQSLKHVPQYQGVEVEKDIHISHPLISDKKLLTSILQNLIVNGIHYHNPGIQNPKVLVKGSKRRSRVLLEVQDNGLGIPERMKNKVFEMFYRGNTKSKGSGLGLYIVKSAVDKLGGSVELESEEGKGSCFSILLPEQAPLVDN
ncbi:MAG: PAS domain S-box protein [Bacteroidota bacterium]